MENETEHSRFQWQVEVAFADKNTQVVIPVSVSESISVEAAIRRSGILVKFPYIDLTKNKVGVFGEICLLSTLVQPGDRIEIYRALITDPKKNRRCRAEKQKVTALSQS